MTRADTDPAFEELLEHLRDSRGFDHTPYKRPGLVRRFQKRMQEVGAKDYAAYRALLEERPEEYGELFDTILVNATRFFRDREAWRVVERDVLPALLGAREAGEPIRVWSAGCASGEEAYTAALLLREALGEESFSRRVKIYATDVDESALVAGRLATYAPEEVERVPERLRELYFEPAARGLAVRQEIRRAVVFGRNDLLGDPPNSRIDLLLCRNTLMYFDRAAQTRILDNFFVALRRDGVLFLGKAEAPRGRDRLFVPYDLRRRLFVKNPTATSAFGAASIESRGSPGDGRPFHDPDARESGFEHPPIAQLVVERDGTLGAANQQACALFGLVPGDIGRPLQDLEISYRPLDLRTPIDEAYTTGRSVHARDVAWPQADGELRYLDVQFAPLLDAGGEPAGIAISFTDTSRYRTLRARLVESRRELATAYEQLRATVAELETTNEELQSTNEELETMTDELREQADDAVRLSTFLGSILESSGQSVIALDRELRVTVWSRATAELWGVQGGEAAGEHLSSLDIGLQVDQLGGPIREVLGGGDEATVELRARNRRGRLVRCTVAVSPLRGPTGDTEGIILVTTAESLEE